MAEGQRDIDDFYAEYEEHEVCSIYSTEDWFTSFVQGLLAALGLASLWIKRQQEKPRREFLTWFLDVSKQAFGACYAHVCKCPRYACLSARCSLTPLLI